MKGDNGMTAKELLAQAAVAMDRAYVPYSKFQVGAALLGRSGKVYLGCNVENAAYGPTNCAERSAVFSAISQGEREFAAIAVVGGLGGKPKGICPPCGVCRQVLREFCPDDFLIHLQDADGTVRTFTLAELLPQSFGGAFLEKEGD